MKEPGALTVKVKSNTIFFLLVFLNIEANCLFVARDINGGIGTHRACIIDDLRNSTGVCKQLTNCPAVLALMWAGVSPTACSKEGPAFVCCPTGQRISAQKCQEFSQVLTEPLKSANAIVFGGKQGQRLNNSGPIKCELFTETFIVGGRNASAREYPYHVGLGYGSVAQPSWKCGGTLIDPEYVVTAAHCVITEYGPPTVIILGDTILNGTHDSTRVLMNVSQVYPHPQYKPPLQYNDIALIKLAQPVTLSRAILPACLPDPEDRLDRAVGLQATGWGKTGTFESQSNTLQTVLLGRFDTHDCTSFFESDKTSKPRLPKGIIPSQFCAGDKNSIRDTCMGDSGGPLTTLKNKDSCVHYIIGITSFGSTYCGYQQPGVYTNILSYLDWIEDIAWYNGSSQRSKLNNNNLFLSPLPDEQTSKSTTPSGTTLKPAMTNAATIITSSTTVKPTTVTIKPTTTTVKPTTTTIKPTTTTVKPTTTAKPATTTVKPTRTTKDPTMKPATSYDPTVQLFPTTPSIHSWFLHFNKTYSFDPFNIYSSVDHIINSISTPDISD